jgi:hypothetical protein
MAGRRLVSLRRVVPEPAEASYDALWLSLAADVREHGGHAWRFASAAESTLRLEFLEHAGDADPRRRPAVLDLLRRLDAEVAPAAVEEWDDR